MFKEQLENELAKYQKFVREQWTCRTCETYDYEDTKYILPVDFIFDGSVTYCSIKCMCEDYFRKPITV